MLLQIAHLVLIVGSIIGGFSWIIHYLKGMTETLDKRLLNLLSKLELKVTLKICKLRRDQFMCSGSGPYTLTLLTKAITKLNLIILKK